MKRFLKVVLMAVLFATLAACGRIETGHTGVRTNFNKQVSTEEVKPGFYVAITDSVEEYVTNEITLKLENLHPQAKGSYLKDLDLQFNYSIEPSCLAESVSKYKNRTMVTPDGDKYPMGLYVAAVMQRAVMDAVAPIDPLEASLKRAEIESGIVKGAVAKFTEEKMDACLKIHQVLVNNLEIDPALQVTILNNARAKKENETKDIEIDNARKEALRIKQLTENANSEAYIRLLNAQANMKIAEGIAAGKVNTIVVPNDFKGIVNAK